MSLENAGSKKMVYGEVPVPGPTGRDSAGLPSIGQSHISLTNRKPSREAVVSVLPGPAIRWRDPAGMVANANDESTEPSELKSSTTQSNVAYARFNSALLLSDVNEELCDRLGRSRSELIGCRFDALFYRHQPYDSRTITSDGTVEFVQAKVLMLDKAGRLITADTSSVRKNRVLGSLETLTVIVKNALAVNEASAEISAVLDPLTGVLNNRSIRHELELAIKPEIGRPITLMLFNLDGFKVVNDSFGFENGNSLLKLVAERLNIVLGARGSLGRSQADEFVVVSETGVPDSPWIGRELIDSLKEPFKLGFEEIYVSASIGVSSYPLHGSTAEQLICAAESALDFVKKAGGRATGYFDARMSTASRAKIHIERYLRKALARGEFELEYQPRLDLASMEVVAIEALIRWNHPLLGRVPPLDFITVAEERGLIVDIGHWVLNEACDMAMALAVRMKRPIRVSVNVSAHQLKSADFYDQIVEVLERTRLPPRLLELELTESALIEDFKRSALTLHRLKSLGILLAVDDFGTGYSSLAYLQSFPFDTLKLDRSFVNHREACGNNAKFVKALIDLAHALDLSVVAEGVETDEVLGFLRTAKCDEIQGYLLSKPLGVRDLNVFLNAPLPTLTR